MSVADTIAKKITESGVTLTPKHNTIFTAINEYGMASDLVSAAIKGLINVVSAEVNTYRNAIIPDAKALRTTVKSKTVTAMPNIASGLNLHILERDMVIDILSELNLVYPKSVSDFTKLPEKPLIIESKLEDIKRVIRSDNHKLDEAIQAIVLEYSDKDLLKLHDDMFSNVSRTNPFARSLFLGDMHTVNDATLLLAITIGYINNTMGVSNMPVEKAKTNYLYGLREALTTILAAYNVRYDRMIANDVLIVKNTIEGNDRDIYLIDKTYQESLDTVSANAIVGASFTPNLTRVRLSDFIANVSKYNDAYEAMCKKAAIKASFGNISALRTAYVVSITEFLEDHDDDSLANLGITREGIVSLTELTRKYIAGLSEKELLDITEVTRYLIAIIVYNQPNFLVFSGYMNHYSVIYPKFTVEELATISTVGIIIDKLLPQFSVSDSKS